MAEQNTAGSAPAFPKLLPLPKIERPLNLPVDKLADVKSADDLPSRLVFGDLVAGSFKVQKKGWAAEWRDADGHQAKFRHAGGLSSLELNFEGEEMVTLVSAERFSDLDGTVQNLQPGSWLEKLGARLSARHNLKVFAHREDDAVAGNFADGPLLTLTLPVPADRLLALYELHKQMQQDAAITTNLDGYARLHFSVVNYLEGVNPAMLNHPVGLVLHHVNALGTPAGEMPMREEDDEGSAAWTLRRSHYLYIAHCAMRDAARLVERLADAGFIGAADGREGYPNAAEFGAALMPFGYEYVVKNVYWFDAARRRRVFYPDLGDSADRNALGAHSGDIWLKSLIRDAQKLAEQFKADTARSFAEGMAQQGDNSAGLH